MSDLDYAIQGFEGFLRNPQNLPALQPDLILRFGREPASKSLLLAIKKWNRVRHIYFSDADRWSDIQNTTTDFIHWNGSYFEEIKSEMGSSIWLKKWKRVEANYRDKTTDILANEQVLTDGAVYHHITPLIPDDWAIFISNSFPARDHSMFARWNTQKVFTNRGASGIDGITSTAMGVNSGLEQPVILFTGDLAFLHDANALLNHQKLAKPMVIVVINNGGGSIFRMLPVAKHKQHFNTYFETPQCADITRLAKSYGITVERIETVSQLKQFDPEAFIAGAKQKLHIVECKTDPDASMQLRNELWDYKL
jgi:2-succinyl-5-enolpyruvyl-6-hydroxy-3-cyclohexene-1-carboxylate synthase